MTYPTKNYTLANFSLFKLASLFLLLLTLTACGGGGGGTQAGGSTLSGTAATGAAIFGKVSIFGNNGGVVADVQTDASGKYSADVSGLTPPFCVCIIPDDGSDAQYSYAKGAGTANITPLTTLTLYYANGGQDPAQLADASAWPTASQDVVAAVPNAQAVVNANFANLLSAQGFDASSYDFFTTQFIPGDQFDKILDQLGISFTGGLPVITVDGGAFTFDPNIEITTGGNLGTVTFTGAGSNLLSAAGRTFTPGSVLSGVVPPESVLSDVLNYHEVDQNGDLTGSLVAVGLNPSNQVAFISVNSVEGETILGWGVADQSQSINGASYNGTTVTFSGVTLNGITGTTDEIILNGSLTRP